MEQFHRLAWEVITALGMLGHEAESALPLLQKLSTLGDRQIAERSKAALRQIRG